MNLEFGVPYHHKTIDQCRVIGARGGRRSGMTRRVRHLARVAARASDCPGPELETAHEASMLLDARFPHLRNAWVRTPRLSAA